MTKKSLNSRHIQLKGVAQSVAQKESDAMPYLEQRNSIYWFRRRAPKPLEPGAPLVLGDLDTKVGANGYVRFTLGTADKKVAIKLARKFAHLLDQAAERRERLLTVQKVPTFADHSAPTAEEIQYAADTMYATLLAADETQNQLSIDAAFADESDTDVRLPDRLHWSSKDLPPPTPAGQVALLRQWAPSIGLFMLQATGKPIYEISSALLPFAQAIRRYIAALEKRHASEIVETPAPPPLIWSWDDAFDYYFKKRQGLSSGTQANYRLAWESLKASAKVSPAQLKKRQVVAWLDEISESLHAKTAQDRLTAAKAVWLLNQSNEKIPEEIANPFRGLEVYVDDRIGTSRAEFSMEELTTIFRAPPLQTDRAVSIHAGYWLPLLALFHGGRLEELTGLEVRDLEDWENTFILHIRENTIRPRLKGRRKTQRSVPLHPELIRLGFGDYNRV